MSLEFTTAVTPAAWEALEGAYDLQVHVAPDVIARRIVALHHVAFEKIQDMRFFNRPPRTTARVDL